MPPLIEQQKIPDNEEHPYVGDSIGGVEYVSGFLSKNFILQIYWQVDIILKETQLSDHWLSRTTK